MAELRVGLIGYGGWARTAYVPALRLDGRAAIVAAAAPSAETRERVQADLGPELAVYESHVALLGGADIDAALIAVPNPMHEATVRAALDAGVPFLYEPPVAGRAERVRPMLRDLLAAPQITHADLELGYLPVLARLRELVAAGDVGEPQTVGIRLHAAWGSSTDAELGGVFHLAPWYLDALDHAVGSHPSRVLVLDGRGRPGRMQAYAIAILDYAGVWGPFQMNLAAAGDLQTELEVNGADGDVVADLMEGELRVRTRQQPHWRTETVPALQPHAGWPGMHECVRAFLDAVESGETSPTGPETLAAHHLTGLAAEASMDSGGWAAISPVDELRPTRP